jgi:hypothetical protein
MNSFFILKLIVPGGCGRHILIDICRHIITTLLFTVIPLNDILYYPAWGGNRYSQLVFFDVSKSNNFRGNPLSTLDYPYIQHPLGV